MLKACRTEAGTYRMAVASALGAKRIALVDDHRMFADGFAMLLKQQSPGWDVACFENPMAFLQAYECERGTYDLVIIDLVMQTMNGLTLLASILEKRSAARVLMLSGIGGEPPVAEMRKLGARGFLHKSASTEVLLEAVERVLAGGIYFEGTGVGAALAGTEQVGAELDQAGIAHLAPRQLEILMLMARGQTNKSIAAELGISENTVKTHMRAIFETLGVHTRTACVRKAQMLGLI